MTFELTNEAYALLERALAGARRRAGTPLSDAEALEAVVRDALATRGHAASDEVAVEDQASSSSPTDANTGDLAATADHGAKGEPTPDETAPQLESSNEHVTLLLRIIGRRRHWTLDELLERSGLSFSWLQHGLLLLELAGRIRHNGYWVDPA